MQRDVAFSGPVSEGFADDSSWSVGGIEVNRPIADAIKELCDATDDNEYCFRADLWLTDSEAGYSAVITGTLGGFVATLVDNDELEEKEFPDQQVVLRGDVNYDPISGGYMLGPSNIEESVMNGMAAILGHFIGTEESVNVVVVMQMEPSYGYEDLPVVHLKTKVEKEEVDA